MSAPPIDPGAGDLEAALRDLGAHLDLGPGETAAGRTAFVAAVLDRLDPEGAGDRMEPSEQPATHPSPPADLDRARHRRRRLHRVLAAAAIVVAVLAGLLAVTPSREAIARWLGIGAISITGPDGLRPDGDDPAPGAPTGGPPATTTDLVELAGSLPFAVRLPDEALTGELLDAQVDPSVPVGLIELRYDGVTIVEIGSKPGGPPMLGKVVGPGTVVTPVDVGGRPGSWLSGDPHQVASMDPDGAVRVDTVRRAGDVLIWEHDGVTVRIEGAPSLAAALAIAATLD